MLQAISRLYVVHCELFYTHNPSHQIIYPELARIA